MLYIEVNISILTILLKSIFTQSISFRIVESGFVTLCVVKIVFLVGFNHIFIVNWLTYLTFKPYQYGLGQIIWF